MDLLLSALYVRDAGISQQEFEGMTDKGCLKKKELWTVGH